MTKKSGMKLLWRSVAATGIAASMFAATACGNGDGDGGGGGDAAPIKIGVLTGMTGAYAAYGEPQQRAVELFVKKNPEINGHPVELTVLDSESNEGAAVNQFRKLAVEEQVHAVVGPSSSGEGIALRPFSRDLTTPTVVLASSDDIITPRDEADYIFKEYTGTHDSMTAQLQYAKDQGWDTAAVLYTNDGYGQDAAEQVDEIADEIGVEVTGKEPIDSTATDVTAQLGNIADGDPDVVLVWAGAVAAQAVVAKSAESISFEPQLFGSPGAGSPDYITSGGSAVEGALIQGSVVLAPDGLEEDNPLYESTRELVDSYQEEYGEVVSQYSANAWDGMALVYNALEQAGDIDPTDVQGTRDVLRDSLENNTEGLVGVNAIYTYTPDYHGSKGVAGLAVLRVEDGEYVIEETYE